MISAYSFLLVDGSKLTLFALPSSVQVVLHFIFNFSSFQWPKIQNLNTIFVILSKNSYLKRLFVVLHLSFIL